MQRTVPVLLTAAVMVIAAAACSGGKSSSSSTTTTTTASSPAASPAPSAAATTSTMAKSGGAMKGGAMAAAGNGASVYNANCSSCHQANGKGQPSVFPPLAGNPVVTGPAAKVIHIVKNGLSGKIMVGSATYNGTMPPWKNALSAADIASVITYIRSSWGNHASAVTAAQVSATK